MFSPSQHCFGGKRKLVGFMKLVLEENDLLDGTFVEVYAGGAACAIRLLVHGSASRIYLNDLNSGIHAFWTCVIEQPEELMKAITEVPVTMDEWHRQKAIQKDQNTHTPLEIGLSPFFLNRTNRSGIISGGVIGGTQQTGRWTLDARCAKPDLIRRIEQIAALSSRIRLYHTDASDFIRDVLPGIPGTKSLVYLDPPYYHMGPTLYENQYTHDDHVTLSRLVNSHLTLPWMISYDCAPEIMGLHSWARSLSYRISHSAQRRYRGAEVLFFSRTLRVPDVHNPTQPGAAQRRWLHVPPEGPALLSTITRRTAARNGVYGVG